MNILDKLSNIDDLNLLWNLLPNARLVGGVVRDLMIDKPISDIDLATPEPPETVMAILKNAGVNVIPTGLSHGTVMAIINHCHFEITTLRKDVKTDGRHAEVVWTNDWQEDATRRDFTMNAMFCDKEGIIYDFYNGQHDLFAGNIRFVGDANLRIQEDVLRVLRYFRFYARYGHGAFDLQAIDAIQRHIALITTLSAERIWAEIQKILTGPQADFIIQKMDEYGVLSEIMPFGYDVNFFQKLVRLNAPGDAVLRLAALVTENSHIVAKKLRLSRKEETLLKSFQKEFNICFDDTEIKLRQLRASYDLDLLLGYSWIKQTKMDIDHSLQWGQWRKKIIAIQQPIFPIKGKDLYGLGMKPGIEMGNVLSQIKEWWVHNGCYAGSEECIQWFKNNKEKTININ